MPKNATSFTKGNPGRPAGALDYGRTRSNIARELEAFGFNWLEEAIGRYRDPNTPNASKDYCLGLITDRVAPKLKAVEITGRGAADLNTIVMNIVAGSVISPTIAPSAEPALEIVAQPVFENKDRIPRIKFKNEAGENEMEIEDDHE